jgi:hypothetical protein
MERLNDVDYLTTEEVAESTRSPASTERYWRHLGVGPASFRVRRRVLYLRSEVLKWLAEQEAASRRAA